MLARAVDPTGRRMYVLVVNPPQHALPEGTSDLLRDIGWHVTPVNDYATAIEAAGSGSIDAVILTAPQGTPARHSRESEFDTLLKVVDARHIAGIVVADGHGPAPPSSHSLIDTVDRRVLLGELRGRFAMIERYHALVTRLDGELSNMQRLSQHLQEHFREVDQEMGLAARLQRDFLPDLTEPRGPENRRNVQFAALYQPASWVSGDIFDVFSIDQQTTGFYVADVVGHGLAAGLLTMFIKRAIVPKGGEGNADSLPGPSEMMAALNDALTEQGLPNCQFVTACYGQIDHSTLTLQFARGGHPYPILIARDGTITEPKTPGGLLGIFKGEEFPTLDVRLHPGDKVLLYTDGVELAWPGNVDNRANDGILHQPATAWRRKLEPLAELPIQEMLARLESQVGATAGPLKSRDDVTIVGLEILRR